MRFFFILMCFTTLVVSCENTPNTTTQTATVKEVQNEIIAKKEIMETVSEEETSEVPVPEKTAKAEVKKAAKPAKRPVLSFVNKSYDYGMIAQGDKVDHTFQFTNKGNSDLIIKNAEASCGCTTPSYPFTPIAPGETGTISVTFNSTGKLGTQRPTITVISNAYPRTQTLHLEGFVADKISKKEAPKPTIIEDDVNISPDGNTTKGEDTEGEINIEKQKK